MKKIWGWIVGVVLVVLLAVYIIWNGSNTNTNSGTATNAGNSDTSGTNDVGLETSSTAEASTTASVNGSVAVAKYQDGTYTGPVADAIYGKLQLVVTVSGGSITNITWPVYPNSPGHTAQVNASALPELEQEAITAQNANVSIISGATQTSEAFQQSLASALAQAQS